MWRQAFHDPDFLQGEDGGATPCLAMWGEDRYPAMAAAAPEGYSGGGAIAGSLPSGIAVRGASDTEEGGIHILVLFRRGLGDSISQISTYRAQIPCFSGSRDYIC